jgi:hypothetical protein
MNYINFLKNQKGINVDDVDSWYIDDDITISSAISDANSCNVSCNNNDDTTHEENNFNIGN